MCHGLNTAKMLINHIRKKYKKQPYICKCSAAYIQQIIMLQLQQMKSVHRNHAWLRIEPRTFCIEGRHFTTELLRNVKPMLIIQFYLKQATCEE